MLTPEQKKVNEQIDDCNSQGKYDYKNNPYCWKCDGTGGIMCDCYEGEWVDDSPCRMNTLSPKQDKCSVCGKIYTYP